MSLTTLFLTLYNLLEPFWWVVATVVAIPLLCLLIHSYTFYVPDHISAGIGLVFGVPVALITPYLSGAGLDNINTIADWAALGGIALVTTWYIWLILHILSRD